MKNVKLILAVGIVVGSAAIANAQHFVRCQDPGYCWNQGNHYPAQSQCVGHGMDACLSSCTSQSALPIVCCVQVVVCPASPCVPQHQTPVIIAGSQPVVTGSQPVIMAPQPAVGPSVVQPIVTQHRPIAPMAISPAPMLSPSGIGQSVPVMPSLGDFASVQPSYGGAVRTSHGVAGCGGGYAEPQRRHTCCLLRRLRARRCCR